MLKVTNFKKLDKKGLLAVFEVEAGDIKVSKCKLLKFDNKYFISGPSEEYEKDGQRKFFELTRFNGETKNKVLDTVLALYGVPKQSKPAVSDDDIPF